MKLLREKYKTWEGANKRCRFENGVAESEFRNGYKAKLYHYTVVEADSHDCAQGNSWRVARHDRGRRMAEWLHPRLPDARSNNPIGDGNDQAGLT